MATARDIVAGAYQRLSILALGEELDADRAAVGLAALNDMLSSWSAEGLSIGLTLPLTLSTTFGMDDKYHQAVKALLAVELADQSGVEITGPTVATARRGWKAILAGFTPAATGADVDESLKDVPANRRYGWN